MGIVNKEQEMDKSVHIPGAPEVKAAAITAAEMKESAERLMNALRGWQFDRKRHGCLFDRGSADSYYGRGSNPHYGGVGGDSGPRVENLTTEEVREYAAGYEYNERFGDKKDWR